MTQDIPPEFSVHAFTPMGQLLVPASLVEEAERPSVTQVVAKGMESALRKSADLAALADLAKPLDTDVMAELAELVKRIQRAAPVWVRIWTTVRDLRPGKKLAIFGRDAALAKVRVPPSVAALLLELQDSGRVEIFASEFAEFDDCVYTMEQEDFSLLPPPPSPPSFAEFADESMRMWERMVRWSRPVPLALGPPSWLLNIPDVLALPPLRPFSRRQAKREAVRARITEARVRRRRGIAAGLGMRGSEVLALADGASGGTAACR